MHCVTAHFNFFLFKMPLCGGISDSDEQATPEIQGLVTQIKAEVSGKMNAALEVFEAICYRSQVVAGRNYFVKVSCIGLLVLWF